MLLIILFFLLKPLLLYLELQIILVDENESSNNLYIKLFLKYSYNLFFLVCSLEIYSFNCFIFIVSFDKFKFNNSVFISSAMGPSILLSFKIYDKNIEPYRAIP